MLCYYCVIEVVNVIRSITACCRIIAAITFMRKKSASVKNKEPISIAVKSEFYCYLNNFVLVLICGVLKRRHYHVT